MKNVSKNKFLTCFRPEVVDVDAMLESRPAVDRSTSRRFSCIPVADKHEKKNSETKPMFLEQGCQKYTENWVVPQNPKRRLVKSRRAHHKNRYSQDCFGSKRSYSAEYTESGDMKVKSMNVYMDTNINEIKATELSMSSSSSNSQVSESKNTSKYYIDNAKDQLEKQNKFIKCFGIYLLLISLAVTVFWGKYYGVILTPIWLCFFSLWKANYHKPKEGAKLRNTVSKGYKNRDHNRRTGHKELP